MNPIIISLPTAMTEIYQTVDQHRRDGIDSPFFFIVGAGISNPPIPLASAIEAACRQESSQYKAQSPAHHLSAMESYSFWFESAFPDAAGRQRYLRKLMESSWISKANFRLAHILLDGTVARIVITPNFDDLLSRALTLFGERPIVSDHPSTLGRINPESKDVQIVHVHGSYWFYDCCNLADEIEDRASHVGTASVKSRLGELLHHRSPIVIGYSGWDNDVIMQALKQRLAERLGVNIYWFCYKKSQIEDLPDWLKCGGVKFVVADDDCSEDAAEEGAQILGKVNLTSSPGSGGALQASEVFDEFIRRFKLPPPPLTKDPLGFFVDQLRRSLIADSSSELEQDTYAIRGVIDRLEKLREFEKNLDLSPQEISVERFRDAIRRSDYSQALIEVGNISIPELSPEVAKELMFAVLHAVSESESQVDIDERAYDFIITTAAHISQMDVLDEKDETTLAFALVGRAIAYAARDDKEREENCYKEVVNRFRSSAADILRYIVATARFNMAENKKSSGNSQEALRAFREIEHISKDDPDRRIEFIVSRSEYEIASILSESGNQQEALGVLSSLRHRLRYASSEEEVNFLAKVLIKQGVLLAKERLFSESLSAFEAARDLNSSYPQWQRLRMFAMQAKLGMAAALAESERLQEAKDLLESTIEEINGASDDRFEEVRKSSISLLEEVTRLLGDRGL